MNIESFKRVSWVLRLGLMACLFVTPSANASYVTEYCFCPSLNSTEIYLRANVTMHLGCGPGLECKKYPLEDHVMTVTKKVLPGGGIQNRYSLKSLSQLKSDLEKEKTLKRFKDDGSCSDLIQFAIDNKWGICRDNR